MGKILLFGLILTEGLFPLIKRKVLPSLIGMLLSPDAPVKKGVADSSKTAVVNNRMSYLDSVVYVSIRT